MENVTDADYMYRKRVGEDFKTKGLREYHDLYVQSNTLLLADTFQNFINICIEIYKLSLLVLLLHQD